MKKFFMMLAIMFASVLSMNAQVAVQTQELFDNTYVTVGAGVATPLVFEDVFPLNPTATVAIGKQFTPIFGAEVEGTAWFGSHYWGPTDVRFDANAMGSHNVVRGTYVGVNGTVNLTNLFRGYQGAPRFFEVGTVLGAGWIHTFIPNVDDKSHNYFGVKTGLDFAFNLGKTKKHTVSVRPSVLWDVTNGGTTMPLQFNARTAQLQLAVAYTYHFKTTNGTHYFKTYDVGALIEENNRLIAKNQKLKEELTKRPKEVYVHDTITNTVTNTVIERVPVTNNVYVFFEKNSAELDEETMKILDKVEGTVEVVATASPEGSTQYNKELSQRRADVVKEYLESRGVKVIKSEGLGVTGNNSGRVAIVSVGQ